MKIARRKETVTLNQGDYQSRLSELMERTLAAQRDEASGAVPKRAGTKSEANRLAREYDELVAEAEANAVKVDVYEISNTDWQKLADEHPPRDGEAGDAVRGLNMKTFPPALLALSLDPDSAIDVGDLSRVHYVKLETAAWNVNVGDDALPKFSLVSLLKQESVGDSKPPNDSE